MLLVVSTKIPTSYIGRENSNTWFKTCTKRHKGYFARVFAQIHKSEGMLLQYSGAALVRDADIEMV